MGAMLESLLELGPSALDLEIRSLSPEGGGSLGLMESFLRMIRSVGMFLSDDGDVFSQTGAENRPQL